MNISTESGAMASGKNRLTDMLNPKAWTIKWKIKINFFLRAVLAIGLIVLVVNLFQHKNATREANNKLLLLTHTKSRHIEDYFDNVNQQLRLFSSDQQTIDAFNQLTESFLNIENDNYFTAAATSMDKVNSLVEGFYSAEIIPALDAAANNNSNLRSLLPADNKQRILQYLYLAANSRPLGSKGSLNKAEDGSTYSMIHAQYHPEMLKFARLSAISDILLVDYKSGYVTYSMNKNLDFASNLFQGPYKNSGLGMAFKKAIGQQAQGSITITDASQYVPSFFRFSSSSLLKMRLFFKLFKERP